MKDDDAYEFAREAEMRAKVREILKYLGEDTARAGLLDTPERVVKSWKQLYGGYIQHPKDVIKTFEDITADEMIVVRDIEFYSMCEHHMLPFIGVAHFGYLPDKKVLGLSKFGRLVDVFARRLQVQENLTNQIVDAFVKEVKPQGAGCIIEAKHLCMSCRGVMKQKAEMVTSKLTGHFKNDHKTRAEFFQHVYRR